jgi:hypothetical protein
MCRRRASLRIAEPTRFATYIAVKRGASLSLHVEHFIECLRAEMRAIEPSRKVPASRGQKRKSGN